MKEFVFLYPIPEYIDSSIGSSGGVERDGFSDFKAKYKCALNDSIDQRYRQQGFDINYVIFDGHEISDTIELKDSDRIIEAGLDFNTHIAEQANGEHLYPDSEKILNQLPNLQTIRIGGFHLWDCVEKLAETSHKKGLDVLVDEDLTEILGLMIQDPNFRTDKYPSYNPRREDVPIFDIFMKARRTKPWLWQDY